VNNLEILLALGPLEKLLLAGMTKEALESIQDTLRAARGEKQKDESESE